MPQRDDNRQLYRRLVKAHGAELYRFARRSCGEAATAEDLVADACSEAWRSIDGLRDPDRGRAWLFRILRRRCSRYFAERDRRGDHVPLEAADSVAAPTEDPLSALALRQHLQQALDGIEPRLKEPLLMVFVEGLTCRECAEALDLPLGTVLSRIHRARRALRSILTSRQDEGTSKLPKGWRRIEGSG